MKKFFTLCAALTFVMGASAAPQFASFAKADKLMPKQRVLGHTPAKIAAQKTDKAIMASSLTTFANRKAQAAAYELTYDELSIGDYGTDVWFRATTSDGAWAIAINPNVPMDQLEMGKVYGLDDMLLDYTYITDAQTYEYYFPASIEFVLEENEMYGMVFDANMVAEDGTEFHASYKPLEVPAEFTEVEMDEVTLRLKDFREDLGAFQFTFDSEEYGGALCIASTTEIAGTYTVADVYGALNSYTYLYVNGGMVEAKLCNFEAEITSLGANDYAINAKFYSYNGNVYVMNAQYVEPKAEKAVSITANDLKVDDSAFDLYMLYYGYGLVSITASNDNYGINGTLITYDGEVCGNYDDADHSATLVITGEDETESFSSNLVVTKENGYYAIKGDVLCWDNTVYTLDLSFEIPAIAEEREFLSLNGGLTDFTAELGAIQIYSEDDEDWFSVVLDMNTLTPGQHTEFSAAYASYCQIIIGSEVYPMYSIDFDLDIDGESYTLTGDCQAGNILWHVNISGEIDPVQGNDYDDPDNDLDIEFAAEDINTFEVGSGQAYISVDRGNEMFSTVLVVDGDELPAGVYEINDHWDEVGSAWAGEISGSSIYPTFYGTLDDEGYVNVPLWLCVGGTIEVSYDLDGVVSLNVNAVNTWGRTAHIVVNPQGAVGIDAVSTMKSANGKFMKDNSIVIRNNGTEYNTFGQMTK